MYNSYTHKKSYPINMVYKYQSVHPDSIRKTKIMPSYDFFSPMRLTNKDLAYDSCSQDSGAALVLLPCWFKCKTQTLGPQGSVSKAYLWLQLRHFWEGVLRDTCLLAKWPVHTDSRCVIVSSRKVQRWPGCSSIRDGIPWPFSHTMKISGLFPSRLHSGKYG